MATGQSPLPPGGRNFKIGGRSLSAAERTWLLAQLNLPEIGTLTASDITDSTAAGQAMLTAATAAAQKVLLGIPKIYRATLTQAGTAAPVATVLENTLSAAVVWARTSAGIYTGTLSGAFTADKTSLRITGFNPTDPSSNTIVRTSANVVTVTSYSTADGITYTANDDIIHGNVHVEILVYP